MSFNPSSWSSPPGGTLSPSTIGFASSTPITSRRPRNSKKLSLNFVPHSRSLSLNAQEQVTNITTATTPTPTSTFGAGPPPCSSCVRHYRTPHSASAPTLRTPLVPPPPSSSSIPLETPPSDIVPQTTTVTGTYDSEQKFKSYEFGENNLPPPPTPIKNTTANSKSGFSNGPVCILPGLYLYSEPSSQAASEFDLVVNVAQEVPNPYICSSPSSSSSLDSFSSSSCDISNDTTISDSSLGDVDVPCQQPVSHPEYLHIPWQHNSAIAPDFAYLTTLIYNAITAGRKVLVHCRCGESRSPTLIIAYVMRLRDWDLNQAYSWVKEQAAIISPNMNFIYQLMEWNRRLRAGLASFANHKNLSAKPKITLMTALDQDPWVQKSAGAVDSRQSHYDFSTEQKTVMTPLSAPIRSRRGFSLHESDSSQQQQQRRREEIGDNETIRQSPANESRLSRLPPRITSTNKRARPRGYSDATGCEIRRSFSESVMCGFSANSPSSIAVSPWI